MQDPAPASQKGNQNAFDSLNKSNKAKTYKGPSHKGAEDKQF